MDNEILIRKKGFFTKEDSGKIKRINKPLSYYLRHNPKLQRNFTIEDLFNLLIKYEDEVNMLFLSYSRGFEIRPYYEELKNECQKNENSDYIEICWRTDVCEKELTIYPHIHEIGKDKMGYSLMCSSVSDFKHLVIKLDNRIHVMKHIIPKRWEKDKKTRKKNIFKGTQAFTFQDFIGVFLYEITWSGYPENRNERSDELDEIIKNIEDDDFDEDDFDIEEDNISWDKFQLKWKEDELEALLKKKRPSQKKIAEINKEIEWIKKDIEEAENGKKK